MIFAKFKNLILSCRIASFYNSVKLILFISLFAQHALVHAMSSTPMFTNVYLEGAPQGPVEYGTPITLYTYASKSCTPWVSAHCNIPFAAPKFVNEHGVSFPSKYAHTRTFIAGVSEDNKTLMPLGYTKIWAEYQLVEAAGRNIHVIPKTTSTRVFLPATLSSGESFDLKAVASGYLAKGAVSVEMSEPNGKTTVLYTHDFYEESMSLGYTLKLNLFQPGRYTFVARFKSSVATNTSSNSPYQTIDVLPVETSNTLSISSTSPIELGNYFMLTSDITSSDEFASGTVEFFDGESSLGVANVNNKQATLITYLTKNPGTHRFRAKYSGDVYNKGSTSSDVSADFTPARTFSLINFVENPTQWDSLAKFKVRVYGAQPEGKVAFYKGDLLLTRSSLVAGVATGEYSGLEVGEHEIHAVYEGDANNLRSMSGSFTQVIVKAHIKSTLYVLAPPPTRRVNRYP